MEKRFLLFLLRRLKNRLLAGAYTTERSLAVDSIDFLVERGGTDE